jgi:carbamate kinase
MGPKVEAIVRYLERGGKRAVITCPEQIEVAVEGRAGTIVEG